MLDNVSPESKVALSTWVDKRGCLLADADLKQPATETSLLKDRLPRTKWRNLIAYWLLGLCNNYGYVVMLSAAHDILSSNFSRSADETNDAHESFTTQLPGNTTRSCNQVSTGAILLADILPSLAIKLTAPFFPFRVQ